MSVSKKIIVALIFSLFFPVGAICIQNGGGSETGNGGDVFVCRDDQGTIERIGMIDFFEGEILFQYHLDPAFQTMSMENIVEAMIDRIAKHIPATAQLYRTYWKNFFTEAMIIDADLEDIPDSEHPFVPTGCEIEQIAIQKEPPRPNYPRYLISKQLWNALDPVNRAGLVMHEIIYRDALNYGHTNSVFTRELNAWLASTVFPDVSYSEFVNRLKEASYYASAPERRYPQLHFHEDNYEFSRKYFLNNALRVAYLKEDKVNRAYINGVDFSISGIERGEVEFYNQGSLKQFYGVASFEYVLHDRQVKVESIRNLYQNGAFEWLYFENAEKFIIGNRELKLKRAKLAENDSNQIVEGVLASDQEIETEQVKIIAKKNSYIMFYPNGNIRLINNYNGKIKTKNLEARVENDYSGFDHYKRGYSIVFYPNENLRQATLKATEAGEKSVLKINQREYILRNSCRNAREYHCTNNLKDVYFHEDGSFKAGNFKSKTNIVEIANKEYEVFGKEMIEFSPKGKVLAAGFLKKERFQNAAGESFDCRRVRFFENGFLHECKPDYRDKIKLKYKGREITHLQDFGSSDNVIHFNKEGEVSRATIGNQPIDIRLLGQTITFSHYFMDNLEEHGFIATNAMSGIFTAIVQNKQVKFGSSLEGDSAKYHLSSFVFKGGRLVRAQLAEDVELRVLGGARLFKRQEVVCFDKDGLARLSSPTSFADFRLNWDYCFSAKR